MNRDYRIGFIGFGHLAKILFEAITKAKIVPKSHILFCQKDPHKMKENEERFGITSTSLKNLVQKSDLVLLCMRPQQISQMIEDLKQIAWEGKWVVSVLAGTKIAYFQTHLGSSLQILRAMPNLASSVGCGMTILSYSETCEASFRTFANIFFGSMGEIAQLSESFADISCAMAASGPGFVARLIEAEAQLGHQRGIEYSIALKIAAQAFAGAARLVSMGMNPKDLVHTIATPNGVTWAGFQAMDQLELDQKFQEVFAAAESRCKELT